MDWWTEYIEPDDSRVVVMLKFSAWLVLYVSLWLLRLLRLTFGPWWS